MEKININKKKLFIFIYIYDLLQKDSIYIGGSITTLFGILSNREKKSGKIIPNEDWITQLPDDYKPSNYMLVENEAYW